MDKNGKLFGKISVVDIIAVLIIVGVVAGTIYKFVSPYTRIDTGQKTIAYTLKINGVRDFTYEYYTKEENIKCFDKKTGEFIGVIKGVRQEPFYDTVMRTDGGIANAEMPGVIIVYLDIEVEGVETENAYFARGTYEIKAGSEVPLNTKYVDVITTVDAISVK